MSFSEKWIKESFNWKNPKGVKLNWKFLEIIVQWNVLKKYLKINKSTKMNIDYNPHKIWI